MHALAHGSFAHLQDLSSAKVLPQPFSLINEPVILRVKTWPCLRKGFLACPCSRKNLRG